MICFNPALTPQRYKNTLCFTCFGHSIAVLAGRGDSGFIFQKIHPSKTLRKTIPKPYDFNNFGAARGGEYCEAVWSGEIEATESMDCIVFYSSLKDAGGALIVLDSSFHLVFFSFCCLPQGLESGCISINIKLLLVFTIGLEYRPGRPPLKKIL